MSDEKTAQGDEQGIAPEPGESTPVRWEDEFGESVLISIRMRRSVKTFKDLEEIASALDTIELEKDLAGDVLGYRDPVRGPRETTIVSFNSASPPTFQIVVDPAWLALLVVVVSTYPQLRAGTVAMSQDLARLARFLHGFSEPQLAAINTAARGVLVDTIENAEGRASRLVKALREARRKLSGDDEEPPHVKRIG